ncbi:MAG TPA: iron-siderophore ABC transporter substrate-binding protein [Bacillus sp. (in: firmicutes)]|uniref:ABC transporter substrate-binding protein n=1 Tax=Bacillus litorisediminis TaxID=2922713 RepID=UPI001FAF99E4|nr:iron-siderophore ABC transporter substrate-binding protein [Bacillus litorisediminis]HWO77125.1 iron-siderophore ABC transporter substrate-binding protein [Bacillus sp. (in: firmicutes)]
MKAFRNLFVLMVLAVFALSACGTDDTEENANQDTETEKNSGYTVEHSMGVAEIPDTPEKIVVLTNEGTEALLAMGIKPVGAVQSWLGDPWYEHIAEDMEGVEVVGTESEVNLEAVAALEPDLIIGTKLRQEEIYEQLNAIAPTVLSETLRGNWQENFKLYAEAVNQTDIGQQVLDEYNQRIEDLRAQLGDQLNKKISVVRFMAGDVRIYHKDSFSGVIFDQLGFARAEGQDVNDFAETNVTKERIPAMDGDVLFYFTYETGDGEATKLEEEWVNDPLFQQLHAVKSGNAHRVSDAVWNTAGGVIAANLVLDEIEQIFLQ